MRLVAAKGWGDYVSLVPILFMDLAKYPDTKCLEAISQWTRVPAIDTPFQQDAIETFIIAHIALGRFDCELLDSSTETPTNAGAALNACGKLFYWMSCPRELSAPSVMRPIGARGRFWRNMTRAWGCVVCICVDPSCSMPPKSGRVGTPTVIDGQLSRAVRLGLPGSAESSGHTDGLFPSLCP
jgi:hypothetical protein